MDGEIFVPIFLFGSTAFVLYKYIESRNRERMAMIEKGISPTEMVAGGVKRPFMHPLTTLKWGLVVFFVGIGIFAGHWLTNVMMMDQEPAFFGATFLAGGLALIIHYFIASRHAKNNPS